LESLPEKTVAKHETTVELAESLLKCGSKPDATEVCRCILKTHSRDGFALGQLAKFSPLARFHFDSCRHRWLGGRVSEGIEQLRLAVETKRCCKARHEESTPIRKTFREQIAWESVVESFALSGHPKAKRCYAWSFQDDGKAR
jgi:hypothetical protein